MRAQEISCYRCAEVVLPRIVRQASSAGGFGVPILGNMVFRSVQRDRHYLECPQCGAPFEDDDMIRELNGESGEGAEVFGNFIKMVGVLVLATFVILMVYGLIYSLIEKS